MCSLFTASIAIHCLEGIDTEEGVDEDLLQIPLKESWHLAAAVENSEDVVL